MKKLKYFEDFSKELDELDNDNYDGEGDEAVCPDCDGEGIVDGIECERCEGEGFVGRPDDIPAK